MGKVKLTMIICACILILGTIVFWGIDRMHYQLEGIIDIHGGEGVNDIGIGAVYFDSEDSSVYKNYYFKTHVKNGNKIDIKMSAVRCDKYKYTFDIYVDGKKTSATIAYFKHEDLAKKKFNVVINIVKVGDKYNAELRFDNSKTVLYEDIISNPIDYYTGP